MKLDEFIRFNIPYRSNKESQYLEKVLNSGKLAGRGAFTSACENALESILTAERVLLTHSCTAALEMSAMLLNVEPGDEVIMPSFTFVSTANAVVLRGGVPVFVDISPENLCIDVNQVAAAITSRTVGIIPVHYGGLSCDLLALKVLAREHNLWIVEDAAQAIGCYYQNQPLGTFGVTSTLSFHETKNISCGEGGALVINDASLIERAEILLDKGTDRSKFFKGVVDKYTWVDMGSSFLPSELNAAVLLSQLEELVSINADRMKKWKILRDGLELGGSFRVPSSFNNDSHNAHVFPLIATDTSLRDELLMFLKNRNIGAVFHYLPLHSAMGGLKYGKVSANLSVTTQVSECLVRLPVHTQLSDQQLMRTISAVNEFIKTYC
jgi:dTDP-4-amino-4,6-dideoxygalactose transaminase